MRKSKILLERCKGQSGTTPQLRNGYRFDNKLSYQPTLQEHVRRTSRWWCRAQVSANWIAAKGVLY